MSRVRGVVGFATGTSPGPVGVVRMGQRRRVIAELERRPELASAEVVRLRSPADGRKWLASLP